ncbi:uncharacterized protein DUF4272 [Cellulophaga sp. RHA19]|uniref:DUF4272 domain-containing protein n=1 Tax=Cellulophaga sp. RHA19 TaxID=1798237 RepID=UPI000C2CC0D4|nr:DUF4272 domain-containing protein [Cellulophaga sp. RHA19]PKB44183.1 uncharacterized protein DUF4272 [Cellulophaga sp. RHA19]
MKDDLNNKNLDMDNEELEDDMQVRTKTAVAERILGLLAIIGKVHQGQEPSFKSWVTNNGINNYLSFKETEFINSVEPEENDIVYYSWRAEALTSLFWAVNLIEEMPALNTQFDVYSIRELAEIIGNPKAFIKSVTLRSDEDLMAIETELYNQHWRVRDAQLFGKEMPEELNPSVVYERRYALSWIIGYGDDWDSVPTDT